MIMIVRYSDTPVGSYDELVVIPGNFKVPGGDLQGKERMRISRIYVSQRETTYNGTGTFSVIKNVRLLMATIGRRNWNIPKHLARFEFSAPPIARGSPPPRSLTVSVYPPQKSGNPDTPFFRATLTPASYLPSFPLSTAWMPINMTFVQPPIPAGEDAELCGTDAWRSYHVLSRTKRARVMWVKHDESAKVAPKGFWPVLHPWSFGVWLEEATLDITKPEEWLE